METSFEWTAILCFKWRQKVWRISEESWTKPILIFIDHRLNYILLILCRTFWPSSLKPLFDFHCRYWPLHLSQTNKHYCDSVFYLLWCVFSCTAFHDVIHLINILDTTNLLYCPGRWMSCECNFQEITHNFYCWSICSLGLLWVLFCTKWYVQVEFPEHCYSAKLE